MLTANQLQQLIIEVKKKKELRELAEEFVKKQLIIILNQNPQIQLQLKSKFNPKSSDYKQIIKLTRNKLRRAYGLFRQEKIDLGTDDYLELLKKHSSTRERLEIYPRLYSQIFKITGKPKTILDLGCGLNPLSIEFMNLKCLNYYAYDLNEKEIEILNRYFQKSQSFCGQTEIFDITELEKLKNLPKADLCFLFKMTDILDAGKGHKNTEIALQNIPARFIIVSFPTKTMSGKPMNAPRRKWMEWLCNRLGYGYQILEFENEIFYVIKKR